MKHILAALLVCVLLLSACAGQPPAPTTEFTAQPTQTTVPTQPTQTTAPETQPLHSELYIPGVTADDAVRYFGEVCLDAEFVNGGDASRLQRWASPVTYYIYGTPTDEDLQTLARLEAWLNTVEGFPGMEPAAVPGTERLKLYFCTQEEMIGHLGENFWGMDGGVTFWYDGDNAIYEATICYRTDISQQVRNSVILEEIYNGLGPIQDTQLRSDSLIWSGYSEPQWLTPVDELILKLLYHPDLSCGMDAAACEAVIRQLYY